METIVELTASARIFAERAGLLSRLEALRLDGWVGKGDLIELPGGSAQAETFVVLTRRIRVDKDGRQTLIVLLDHPMRSA